MKKKIGVVTGSRADYGLLKPLLDAINHDPDLSLQLIVTGMHLAREYGFTCQEIRRDGLKINAQVNMGLESDHAEGVLRSMGHALEKMGKVYRQLKPDLLVLLGDRFEIFSAAVAAMIFGIPIAHIHGGELTEGAFDDAMRHAMTKMSYMHFTAHEIYRKRVIQLGEEPQRVFNVGSLAMDNIAQLNLLTIEELERELKFKFGKRNLLVIFHPATMERNTAGRQFKNLLAALDAESGMRLIFTKANADPDGRLINRMIDRYVARHRDRAVVFASLGMLRYLSVMQFVDAMFGNSSSGIMEAPHFCIGTINIGDRQKGRLKAASVIDCEPEVSSIQRAIRQLYSASFQARLKHVDNPYGKSGAAKKICKIIKKVDYEQRFKKKFYDLP